MNPLPLECGRHLWMVPVERGQELQDGRGIALERAGRRRLHDQPERDALRAALEQWILVAHAPLHELRQAEEGLRGQQIAGRRRARPRGPEGGLPDEEEGDDVDGVGEGGRQERVPEPLRVLVAEIARPGEQESSQVLPVRPLALLENFSVVQGGQEVSREHRHHLVVHRRHASDARERLQEVTGAPFGDGPVLVLEQCTVQDEQPPEMIAIPHVIELTN